MKNLKLLLLATLAFAACNTVHAQTFEVQLVDYCVIALEANAILVEQSGTSALLTCRDGRDGLGRACLALALGDCGTFYSSLKAHDETEPYELEGMLLLLPEPDHHGDQDDPDADPIERPAPECGGFHVICICELPWTMVTQPNGNEVCSPPSGRG